jgi:putative transposase
LYDGDLICVKGKLIRIYWHWLKENQFVMCKNDDEYPERRLLRLPGYDYSNNGAYYVTICIHDRTQRLFGDVINDKMKLSDVGYIVYNQWQQLPERFPHIQLDEFVVMPNHVHGIVIINRIERAPARGAPTNPINLQDKEYYNVNTVGAGLAPAREYFDTKSDIIPNDSNYATIGTVVGTYKSLVANECLKLFKSQNRYMGHLWQRNYYEHVIRDEKSLQSVRRYISENPQKWSIDKENYSLTSDE